MPWGGGGNAYNDHAADPGGGVLGAYSSECGLQEAAANGRGGGERYPMDGGGGPQQHPYLASEAYDSCPDTALVMDHYVGPFVPYPATPFLQQTQLLHFEPRQLLPGGYDAAYPPHPPPPSVPTYVGRGGGGGDGDCNRNAEDRCGGRESDCYGNSIPNQQQHQQQQAGNLNSSSSMEGGGGSVNLVKFPPVCDGSDGGGVEVNCGGPLLRTFPDASEVEPNAAPDAAIAGNREGSVAGGGGVEPLSRVGVKEPDSFGLQAATAGSGEAELSEEYHPNPDYRPDPSRGSAGIDDRVPQDATTSAGSEALFQ